MSPMLLTRQDEHHYAINIFLHVSKYTHDLCTQLPLVAAVWNKHPLYVAFVQCGSEVLICSLTLKFTAGSEH